MCICDKFSRDAHAAGPGTTHGTICPAQLKIFVYHKIFDSQSHSAGQALTYPVMVVKVKPEDIKYGSSFQFPRSRPGFEPVCLAYIEPTMASAMN